MRVAHVHRIAGIGGSERHLLTLLPALAERGVEPTFIGLDVEGPAPEPFYRELAEHGVPAVRLASRRDLDPLLPVRLARALRRLRPAVVHTHLVHADVYGAVASLGTGALVVSTKHNDDPFRSGPYRLVEQALARRAAALVTITEALRTFTLERVRVPAAKVQTIHYGLDALPAAWAPDDVRAPPGPLLLAVGRLVEQKGLDTAVRALPAIRERHPDALLAIVGEGPLRGRLEALARELGVTDALVLPGRSGDVSAWMDRAELLVHPARWEGFGLVVLEAMLSGLPVVASRVSALPELVEDGDTGVLVAPGDPAQLAGAVARLLDDDELRGRLGAAGQEHARARFSVARMADATAALYRRLAAARTPSAQESAV